jgi:hypothetical protein
LITLGAAARQPLAATITKLSVTHPNASPAETKRSKTFPITPLSTIDAMVLQSLLFQL